jgi:glycosyltransferase involved in cell wall biosynthesis
MMPLVSIVVPTYNRANWVPNAVKSVLAQTMPDLEIIVVDDGSTDNTRELIYSFVERDSRVRYVHQVNQGRATARNNGAAVALGTYIGMLDSDDEYLPETLQNHLLQFQTDASLGMTVGGYYETDDVGNILSERMPWLEGGQLDLTGWLFNCYSNPSAVLARRDWFLKSGGYDPQIHIGDDWDHFLQMALHHCPMAWVRQVACRYRQHAGNSVRLGGVNGVRDNQKAVKRAFDKVFSSPLITPEVAKLRPRALAWARVQVAKMFFLTDEAELGRAELMEARSYAPEIFTNGAAEVLQYLLAPSPLAWGGQPFSEADLNRYLPASFDLTPKDIRLAHARLAMANFFKARSNHDNATAMQQLRTGLRLDPRWWANRGVLSFYIKRAFNRL